VLADSCYERKFPDSTLVSNRVIAILLFSPLLSRKKSKIQADIFTKKWGFFACDFAFGLRAKAFQKRTFSTYWVYFFLQRISCATGEIQKDRAMRTLLAIKGESMLTF
jgi:hypothetical protein